MKIFKKLMATKAIALLLLSSSVYAQSIFVPPSGGASWKTPVASAGALPGSGNVAGDCRDAIDTGIIYCWDGSSWVSAGGGSGVSSLNSLVGALDITAGTGITVTPSGSNIGVEVSSIFEGIPINFSSPNAVLFTDGSSRMATNTNFLFNASTQEYNNLLIYNAPVSGTLRHNIGHTFTTKPMHLQRMTDAAYDTFNIVGDGTGWYGSTDHTVVAGVKQIAPGTLYSRMEVAAGAANLLFTDSSNGHFSLFQAGNGTISMNLISAAGTHDIQMTNSGIVISTPAQQYQYPTAAPTANGQSLVTTTGGTQSWASMLPLSGGTMTGAITLAADAVNPLEPVSFQQFSAAAFGVGTKGSVYAATTAGDGNQALTGPVTADAQVVPNGQNVLLQFQTDPIENGIWTVNTGGAWARPANFMAGADAFGAFVAVTFGPTYGGELRQQIVTPSIVDTDAENWDFLSDTLYTSGWGLNLSGNAFEIPALTAGSLPFAGASGFLEDNDALFWDNSSKSLGINTFASPTASLVVGSFPNLANYVSADQTGVMVSSSQVKELTSILENTTTQGALAGAGLGLSSRDGSATLVGARLGSIQFLGSPTGGAAQQQGARIEAFSTSNWGAIGNAPTALDFYTGSNGGMNHVGRAWNNITWTLGANPSANSGATLNIQPILDSTVILKTKGALGQTADHYQVQDDTGTVLAKIDASGDVTAPSLTLSGLSPSSGIVTASTGLLVSTAFPSAGSVITSTGSAISSYARQSLRVTGTQNIATVTPTNVTELTSASLATGNYKYSCRLIFQSTNVNTGISLRLNQASATVSQVYGKYLIDVGADGVSKNFGYSQLSLATNVATNAVPTVNTDATAIVEGVFTISAPGTVAMQMRSETGTSVSIRTGSNCVIEGI